VHVKAMARLIEWRPARSIAVDVMFGPWKRFSQRPSLEPRHDDVVGRLIFSKHAVLQQIQVVQHVHVSRPPNLVSMTFILIP
jgi:hypothetical protein